MKLFLTLYDWLIYGLAIAAGIILTGIFYLVMQDAILRNLLISPPAWSPPASEYGMLYVTMLSAPWLVRTRGHILLEVLRSRLPARGALVMENTVYVFCIAICAILGWFAINLFIGAWISGEEDHRGVEIPLTLLYGPAAIALPLMGCEFIRFLFGKESLYEGGVMGGEGV